MPREFTPTGLPDYLVRERDGYWWLYRKADMFCLERRSTAKGAVAAAHGYARLAAEHKPEWMVRAEAIANAG